MKRIQSQIIVTNIIIFVVLGVLLLTTLYPGITPTFSQNNSAIYVGNKESSNVCFMFNVYMGTEYIEPIMDTFKEYEFTTTFFIGGIWAEKNMELVKKMSDNGFEIGNHGYLHKDCDKLSIARNRDEILLTEKLILAITQKEPVKLFAPPSGAIGKNMFEVCHELDYKVILWTRDTIDWRDHNASLVLSRATKSLSGGDLVLMHPSKHTLTALKQALEYTKNLGLNATTVTETIS